MEFPGLTQKALQDLISTHLCTPVPGPLRCWVLLSTAPRFRLLALFRVVPAPSPVPLPPTCGTWLSFCLPPMTLDMPLN